MESKLKLVLGHMLLNAGITRSLAISKYGVQNLTDVIHRIRNEHGVNVRVSKKKGDVYGDGPYSVWFIPLASRPLAHIVYQNIK